jgi:imidazolonepropionase-like amidohydrolase
VTTVVRAARLLDGTGGPPLEEPAVVVEGATIAAVFEGEPPPGAVPEDAEVVEAHGRTLLPGLVDLHVHLCLPGDGTPYEEAVGEPDGVLAATATQASRTALDAGVTTVRDTGARGTTALDSAGPSGWRCRGARVVSCGQPITITGGHTWQLGGEADGPDGVRLKVRELAGLGASSR